MPLGESESEEIYEIPEGEAEKLLGISLTNSLS